MNKFFYAKLAVNNIKKNAQTYIPYILTCVLTVMMYYIIRGLRQNQGVAEMHGGDILIQIMELGSWVVVIFSVIFLFYTNSFLIKRRKKEFGLFNILGMEKKHLGKVVLWETIYVAVISIVTGIVVGILFSRLVYLMLMKMLQFPVKMGFEFAPQAMVEAAGLFGVIFIINLLNTLRQIHTSNPIELLKGGNVGEKEPKTKWLITLIGLVCLGAGYYIAVSVENPVTALLLFFVAVILVIIGTYCLFTAGSIAVLKLLRKNKKYYYQPNHFTSVSGMMYRMKQNAAGLASICILATGVLILISTTLSLYMGIEDSLRWSYPRNIIVNLYQNESNTSAEIDQIIADTLDEKGVKEEAKINYSYMKLYLKQNKNAFHYQSLESYGYGVSADVPTSVMLVTVEDYNRLAGAKATLKADETLLFCAKGERLEDTVSFGQNKFKVKENLTESPLPMTEDAIVTDVYYMIVSDMTVMQQIKAGLQSGENEGDEVGEIGYFYGFDLKEEGAIQVQIKDALAEKVSGINESVYVSCVEENRNSYYTMDGGLFFLGIFLGLLFVIATVLIIYYKQISEGYDDRERYQIMQKVGMSKKEVRKSIKGQVINVFFLPLVMAGVHIFFAFPMIGMLLQALDLYNTQLFAMCTVGCLIIFALAYGIIYSVTAKTYYKIVS